MSYGGAPIPPPPAPGPPRRGDHRILATVIGGLFALTAAGITAYATTSGHRDSSRPPAPSPTATAPPTAATTSASPAPTQMWTFLVDEDMEGGGIDMDSWPELLDGDTDVGPYKIPASDTYSDFEATNGATIVKAGPNQPTPAQCTGYLHTSGDTHTPLEDGSFYCVRTSEDKLMLFQVKSINDDSVSLRGYGIAPSPS